MYDKAYNVTRAKLWCEILIPGGIVMIHFNNDYNRTAHPAIMQALAEGAAESHVGYGLDGWCEKGAALIREAIGRPEAEVHYLLGGTQANYTVISALLRPFQSVICADSGHINVHETGAVEHCGFKIQGLPMTDGKITAEQIAAEAELYRSSGIKEHITQPKLVYLSLPTEFGTIYTRAELTAIRRVCDEYGLLLYVDGARLAYGIAAADCDMTLPELASLVDVFYIGGTKCGAMFGEAVVFCRAELAENFRSYIKQNGGMLAKGWLLGLQFATLFTDELYLNIGRRAVEQAMQIREAFAAKGIMPYIESSTNQQFVVLDEAQMVQLGEKYIYEYEKNLGGGRHCVRFCTSWSTQPEEVAELLADIAAL